MWAGRESEREVVALPGLWLPSRPPQLMSHGYASQAHVAPFTGVNRETERRARRRRRVSEPRAAETGRRGRRRRENARGQRPSATSKGRGDGEPSNGMETSESSGGGRSGSQPVKVGVPL